MADPATYRPAPGEIPVGPGVYRFRDDAGRVIYVGKAKSLRARLNSYFQDIAGLHARTQQMVTSAAAVEWTVVDTEVEALQLEYTWIKEFDPRFNIKYRDDKSYPWLAVTVSEEFPRVMVMRGAQRKGVRYFGPYGHAWAIRDTVDTLLRVFPMRSCSAGVFRRSKAVGRPCLLGDIGKCAAPCVGRVTVEEHRAIVDDFLAFMGGQTAGFTKRIQKRMREASEAQEYELAAKLRDDLAALNRVLEKQTVVLGDGTDADVFGFEIDPLDAGRRALADVTEQARPADRLGPPEDTGAARAHREDPQQGVDGVANGPRMAVRAEVAHSLALRPAHDHDPWELLRHRDRKPGVGLVVAVLDVEARVELLDPGVLELERLDLGVDDRPVDPRRREDHLLRAGVQARDVLEVGVQARAQ